MLYTEPAPPSGVNAVSPNVANEPAGMVTAIGAVDATVGVPVTVITAVVALVLATDWLRQAGRLVIQLPDRVSTKVSPVNVTVTCCVPVSAMPVKPMILPERVALSSTVSIVITISKF